MTVAAAITPAGVDIAPSRQSGAQKTLVFDFTQEGSSVESAFTVARERDLWADRDDIALKDAFVMANRPTNVSSEHFVRWMKEVIENPEYPDVPQHHLEAVREAAQQLLDSHGLAVAIQCSWSEATTHLWSQGRDIKRGKPRPRVFRFVGAVKVD